MLDLHIAIIVHVSVNLRDIPVVKSMRNYDVQSNAQHRNTWKIEI